MKIVIRFILIISVQTFAQTDNFLTVTQISDYEITAVVDNKVHVNYGLAYPLTYQVSIPEGSSNLEAIIRERESEKWYELDEKTSDDFFNGINVVRFDYEKSMAFVSIAFGDRSNAIYIQIRNTSNVLVPISFVKITKFYDNRDAVVTSTADDWADYCDDKFVLSCREFRKRELWLSTAIITNWSSSSTWNNIQAQIDSGYIEAIAHSRNHPHTPYADYDSEIAGCKEDIIQKLDLPAQFRLLNKEYVYIWVAPYGNYDDVVDSVTGVNKYLAPRLYSPGYHTLPSWDDKSNKFTPFGVSLEIGPTEINGQWWMGTDDILVLNSTFDSVSAEGGIYHAMIHPNTDVYLEEYFKKHLDYISGRKNIWYVATGHLFLYHFVQIHSNMPVPIVENSIIKPKTTILHQNYPNPFNPITTISYHLSNRERIQLRIFDTLGQQITTLVNENQSPGVYDYQWDASTMTSGVYIYQLRGQTFSLNGKMILLR